MSPLVLAAVLAQAAPSDAPIVFTVPPGSVLVVGDENGEPGEAIRLPPGFFLPPESLMRLEATARDLRTANATLRVEAGDNMKRTIIAAAVAAAVGLVVGGGVMCALAGPQCPLVPSK